MGKILILDVEEDKYDGLVEALSKRAFVRVVSMDRDARKTPIDCPCCHRRMSKETAFTINEGMLQALTEIADMMKVAKSVIIVNKDNPIERVPTIERERCVEVDTATVFRAEALGLIKSFVDGSRLTHYITPNAMAFMMGEAPAAPCTLAILDGQVVDRSGSMMVEEVKFKDSARRTRLLMEASRAVEAIPSDSKKFINSGQMSLI